MDIPVYLFTGFLDAGKTKFIQETLGDIRFNSGDSTLLILCEEGEEEYEPDTFAMPNVFVETIDDSDALSAALLSSLQKKHKAKKVIIEYNGMWLLNELFENLPNDWAIYQEMLFIDSNTADMYNRNMRNLMVDKLSTAEIVVFNRCNDNTDKMQLHKLVRGVSRQCDIAYEYANGEVEYDNIEDPLPFDVNADVIEIEDKDFALWYRDLSEEMDKYIGKTVKFKGLILKTSELPAGSLVIGRKIMTCCIDDIKYAGLLCEYSGSALYNTNDWGIVTAKIEMKYTKVYGKKGPVLMAIEMLRTSEPEQPVATFY